MKTKTFTRKENLAYYLTLSIFFIFSFQLSSVSQEKNREQNNVKEELEESRFRSLYENAHPTPDAEIMLKHNNSLLRKYKKNSTQTLTTAKIPLSTQTFVLPKFLVINTIVEEASTSQPMQNESSISVNPKNPNNLIASSVDYRDNSSTWVYVSDNGGKSWKNINLGKPYPTWQSTNDPSVMFDTDGTGYLMYGAFPRTASGENGVYISKTTDEGKTWTKHIPVIEHKGKMSLDSAFEDKYYVQVDKSPTSPYKGNIYTPWKRVTALDSATQIVFSRSEDKGLTWSEPIPISTRMSGTSEDTTFGQSFPLVTTGPKGQIYAVWNIGPKKSIGFAKSYDGGKNWTEPKNIIKYKEFGTPKYLTGQGVRHTVKGAVRAESYPVIACNYTNGKRSGELYLCWAADSIPNIYFSKSIDEGETWSEPKIVPSDQRQDQFWSWIAVDPISEDIAIMYLDSRNDTNNILVECYVSYSYDGGETWIDRLADDSQSDLRNNPFTGSSFAGDYSGLDFYNGIIYPSFVDMRNAHKVGDPNSDVYTAIVNTQSPSPIEKLSVINMLDNLDKIELHWQNIFETTFGKVYPAEEAKILVLRSGSVLTTLSNLQDTSIFIDNNNIIPFNKYDYQIAIVRGKDTSIIREITVFPGGSKDIPNAALTKFLYKTNSNNSVDISFYIPSKKLDNITPLVEPTLLEVYVNNNPEPYQTYPLSLKDTNTYKTISLPFLEKDDFYFLNYRIQSAHPTSPKNTIVYSEKSQPQIFYIGKEYNYQTYYFDSPNISTDPPIYFTKNWEKTDEFAFSPPNSFTNAKKGNYTNNQLDTFFITPFISDDYTDSYVNLSFYHAAITESGDNCIIEYSLDCGQTWNTAQSYTKKSYPEWADGDLKANDWKYEKLKLDISAIEQEIVKSVYVRFLFRSNPFGTNEGWFLDNIHFDYPTSVRNFSEDSNQDDLLYIYPNPANDLIAVGMMFDKPLLDLNFLQVFDILGNDVSNLVKTYTQNNKLHVEIEQLPAGVYYLLCKKLNGDFQSIKFSKTKN